ncbi:457_t:CDS:2, partial [Scutellospora calospora]
VQSQSMSCGPNSGNSSCLAGFCCSKDGLCGKTESFCGKDCNPNYGVCGEVVISGSSTTVVATPTKAPSTLSEASGSKKNSLGILFLVVLVAAVLL